MVNLRQKQCEVIIKLLNLNATPAPGKDTSELYKVLILDRYTKDIIAPLLRVNELRKHGVTLHLMLEAARQPIPDVPAVYLVQPTAQAVDTIIADAAAGLYDSMHLNFSTSIHSKLVDQLAAGVVRANAVSRVGKLYDQYVSFIALEPSLFSLGLPDAYVQLNDPSTQDTQIEAVVGSIVDGLFSVCVTLGVVPIIRCPRGGVAEHVAAQLDQKLRDALKARNNVFAEGVLGLATSLTRPLLCLFDRNFDMAGALQHSWTYKPLVHDVLGMKLNRVNLGPEATSAPSLTAPKQRSYDVDERDFFWEACGSHPFPKVAEEVETQLQRYKAAVDEINKRTAAGAQEGVFVDADELLRQNTAHLMAAVSSLPELQEQKKTLDKHTNLATSLLAAIKSRGLDAWHGTGEDVLCGKADLAAVAKLIRGSRGNPADKLRLALVWLLAAEGVPTEADYTELEAAVRQGGADPTALAYVRTLKRNNLVGSKAGGAADGVAGGVSGSAATQGAALLDYVSNAVKTLLAGSRQAPVTVALEALMEGKQGTPVFDSFAVFDPKAPAGRAGLERAKGPFREAIVFMIGGGNYQERETILNWASRSSSSTTTGAAVLGGGTGVAKQVVYGATEVLSGEEFVAQLAELGRRSGLGAGGVALQQQAIVPAPGAASAAALR